MPLPFDRNNTYALGVPILSADLNMIQDCIIAGKHGVKTQRFGFTQFQSENTVTPLEYVSDGFARGPAAAGALAAICAISLPPTAVIVGVRVNVDPASTNVLRVSLIQYVIASATSTVIAYADSTLTTPAEVSIGPLSVNMSVANNYTIKVARQSGSGTLDRIHYADVSYFFV